jgi:hypothetical protein
MQENTRQINTTYYRFRQAWNYQNLVVGDDFFCTIGDYQNAGKKHLEKSILDIRNSLPLLL